MTAQRTVLSLALWSTMVAMPTEATSQEEGTAEDTCDDTGLLQKSAKMLKGVAVDSQEVGSSTIQLLSWNAGPTKKGQVVPVISDFVSQQLEANSVDFFNVINYPSLENGSLVGQYQAEVSRCNTESSTKESSASLIYNQERWVLDGPTKTLCFKSGAAILALFKAKSGLGPTLAVVGAHFGMFSEGWEELKDPLIGPLANGYEVVFLGDTNAFEWTNEQFAEGWGFPTQRAFTPTLSATCCYPLSAPGTPLNFHPDRIITTLAPGAFVPVTIVGLPAQPLMWMHKAIGVTLPLASN